MIDEPTQIGDWEPENASGGFKGSVPLRSGLAQSINTVAVQLADEVGIQAVIDMAKRLGVRSELPAVPSLALGSAKKTLLEITVAFGVVAPATNPSSRTRSARSRAAASKCWSPVPPRPRTRGLA